MATRKVITEYLASISPSYNKAEWDRASSSIGNTINNVLSRTILKGSDEQFKNLEKRLDDLQKKRDLIQRTIARTNLERDKISQQIENIQSNNELTDAQKEEKLAPLKERYNKTSDLLAKQRKAQEGVIGDITDVEDSIKKVNKDIDVWGTRVAKGSVFLGLFSTAVQQAWEAAQDFADNMSETSNKFVSSSSIFFDTQIRDIQAKYGVSNTQAQAMSAAMDALGIDISDFAKLPEGTRNAYNELMRHYQEGIESIDTEKLDRFNKSTQEYQLAKVKFEMDLQLIWSKFLAESDALPELLETISDGMESLTNILGSDAFQTGAEILFGIINGILEFVTTPLNWIGSLFGESSNNTTNNNSTTNNNNINVTTSGGISSNQLALDIALQLQNVTTP